MEKTSVWSERCTGERTFLAKVHSVWVTAKMVQVHVTTELTPNNMTDLFFTQIVLIWLILQNWTCYNVNVRVRVKRILFIISFYLWNNLIHTLISIKQCISFTLHVFWNEVQLECILTGDGGLSLLPAHVNHYLVPDCQVAREFLEVLENPVVTGIIFFQTVVHSVRC